MSNVLHNGLRRARARLIELEDEAKRMYANGVMTPEWLRRRNEREREEQVAHIARLCEELDLDDPAVQESKARVRAARAELSAPNLPVVRLGRADAQRSATPSPTAIRPGWKRHAVAGINGGRPVDIGPDHVAEHERLHAAYAARGYRLSGPAFVALKRFVESLPKP